MRQRNDSGHVLHVSAWPTEKEPGRSPFDVGPGEECDFPQLLAGFTSLEPPEPDEAPDEEDPEPATEPDAAPAAKPKTRTKTASADAPEGGEPR